MDVLRFRRPSPAMILALLALFVALGGTSYAALKLPRNSVGTKQLKKNSVVSSKVKPGSLLLSDIKASERSQITPLWAVVDPNGALVRGRHVVSAQEIVPASGQYEVVFDRDVTGCAFAAVIGATDSLAFPLVGIATVAGRDGNANAAAVATYNVAGNPSVRPFHLAAFC